MASVSMVASENKLSLKLLVDTKGHRVLFAEADKEFVDFLFNLLSLPIGWVITVLSKQGMDGSLGKLYGSVEALSDTYKQASQVAFDALLKPTVYASATAPLLLPNIQTTNSARFYRCSRNYNSNCYNQVTNDPSATCASCGGSMNMELTYVDGKNMKSSSPEEGYVKGVVTYMIMDDLEVRPMSSISSITMINRFNVKDMGVLEEKVVDVGMDQRVELLKASLHSKAVLTEVFLKKKPSLVSIEDVD
ncbi:hypothetical protein SLEP1_g5678 [Rubroshorea leprosula]|uniref:DUF674 domain-containing protein n=1 Tax=Rubroshorea leprosula TaxID=152421 RepID=A0AAV5I0T4_9ROSI|nr:hypothetical protein SLEP1_g5678 [Rubroshorea leprosula]